MYVISIKHIYIYNYVYIYVIYVIYDVTVSTRRSKFDHRCLQITIHVNHTGIAIGIAIGSAVRIWFRTRPGSLR